MSAAVTPARLTGERWTELAEGQADEEDLTIWEDNWDDDNIEEDFSKQLKAELEKQQVDAS